jgi:hypothetical protein
MDYVCFGNKFEMPFAPILGTNHHKQTIIFGAALLFDETIPSFVWLFETFFLTAMSGKHPSTIFTDQDAAMAGAIAYIPNLPMLKMATESYTRRMYVEFETKFKDQFVLTGQLLKTEGSILIYMVMHIQSDQEATVMFNIENKTISCSCRKFESIGMYKNSEL